METSSLLPFSSDFHANALTGQLLLFFSVLPTSQFALGAEEVGQWATSRRSATLSPAPPLHGPAPADSRLHTHAGGVTCTLLPDDLLQSR